MYYTISGYVQYLRGKWMTFRRKQTWPIKAKQAATKLKIYTNLSCLSHLAFSLYNSVSKKQKMKNIISNKGLSSQFWIHTEVHI